MSMFEIIFQKKGSNVIGRAQLIKLKLKAMRTGTWFRSLRKIDRALIDLAIIVTHNNIRSQALANNIISVMEKLEALSESNLKRIVEQVGYPLAQKASSLAQKWGNKSANKWRSDSSFASFLAILSINQTRTFKL
jgi:hypothetical protein